MSRPGLLAIAVALVLGGCGNSRTPVRDYSQPLSPAGFHTLRFAPSTVSVAAPSNWIVSHANPPLLATISSGSAIVSVWRFPRTGPVPATPAELRGAQRALLTLSHKRDRGLRLIRSTRTTLRGRPAVELDTLQQINGQDRRVRSLHVYTPGYEIVLEQFSPPTLFHLIDHEAFSPIKRSLRVDGG